MPSKRSDSDSNMKARAYLPVTVPSPARTR
jgi:hypothetical protein